MAKILFLASEMLPFCKTGGLADVAGALPYALQRDGHDVKTVIPYYHFIKENVEHYTDFHIHVSGHQRDGSLLINREKSVPHYFVYHPHYYDRDGIYGDDFGEFGDNDERYAYLCEAALLLCKLEGWKPDVIHINDWQTGIMGPLLRMKYGSDPFFEGTKILFTIHNLAYQGCFAGDVYKKFGLPDEVMRFDAMELHGSASYLKAGLQFADVINAVSPTYAREIQTAEYGMGLEHVIQARSDRLTGVLNGIDTDEWNPQRDPHLMGMNYSEFRLERKERLKQQFLDHIGLPYWSHVPLLGMVSRFTGQKGINLIESVAEEVLQMGTQMVFLGTGEQSFVDSLRYFENKYPQQVRAFVEFSGELSHQIQAASDFFLMPSRFEPCGLTQMYSLRYGTLPIVFHTGGLADTVYDCDRYPENGNGYSFYNYTKEDFLDAITRAKGLFHNTEVKNIVQRRGMRLDFSWSRSAKAYGSIYDFLLRQ
jgi:starch synthase